MEKWSEDENEMLRDLALKGLSAAQIARRLAAVFVRSYALTRNAVIGRASRLGIPLSKKSSDGRHLALKRKSGRREQARPVVVAPVTPVPSRRPVEQSKEARAATTPLWSAPPPHPGRSVAASYAVIALNDDDCRWPIGHVGEKDFHFCCGARLRGMPYCEEHTIRAGGGW